MGTHKQQTQAKGIHSPFRWLWADDTARLAETDVTADDVSYKTVGLQESDGTFWIATATTPTWDQVAGSGTGGNEHTAEDSDVDTSIAAVQIRRRTTGTAAAGLGVLAEFQLDGDPTPDEIAGQIGFAWADAGNPDGVLVILVRNGANVMPMGAMKGIGGTPADIADIAAAMGEGAVQLAVVEDPTLLAAADQSFVIGGDGTNATGADRSGILAGKENRTEGDNSIAMGEGAVARHGSGLAQAKTFNAQSGDAQTERIPIQHFTANNTGEEIGRLVIPDDTHFGISLNIVGRQTTGATQGAYMRRRASGYSGSTPGSITMTSMAVDGTDVSDNPAWDVDLVPDVGANELVITAYGELGEDVVWSGMIELWTVTQV